MLLRQETSGPSGQLTGRRGALARAFVAAVLVLLPLSSCVTAGPPATSRFASNREPAEAFQCALRRLVLDGFSLDATGEDAAVAHRRSERRLDPGAEEWWRIEVSVATGPEGRTVVETVSGVAGKREGPYGAPSVALQGVTGRLSASCTW